jgi:NADH dehydrogenase
MNVLVVGGTGFVGENLCRELVERGHDVTALARNPDEADLPASAERVMGDVTAYDSIEGAFEGKDAVIYLVALSPLFKPDGGDEKHFEIHLGGTENTVRAAKAHDVERYIQMSALGADPSGETAYIRAKGEADEVVKGSGLDWTIFQPSVVFGDGDEFIGFTKLLAPAYFTPLPGGGKTRFQPVWVGDLVDMVVTSLEGEIPGPEAGDEEAADDADGTVEAESEDDGPHDEDGTDDVDDADGDANPYVGGVYEIGGPDVLTLAEVARLAHGADGKPVNVYSVPMGLAGVGLKLIDNVPGAPMGADQYRSLKFDNTTSDNAVGAFGYDESDLKTLAGYLGVDPATARPERSPA